MKQRHILILLFSSVVSAIDGCAVADSFGPASARQPAVSSAAAAAASGNRVNPAAAQYVSVLERLETTLSERESALVALDLAGPVRGSHASAIVRARQQRSALRSLLKGARRILSQQSPSIAAQIVCTDDEAPDSCDDGGSGNGSGGGSGSAPFNSTKQVVVNPSGPSAGTSIATSFGLITVTGVTHDHRVKRIRQWH